MCSQCNLLQLSQTELLWPFMVFFFCIAKTFGRLREAWSVKCSTEFGLFIAENRRIVRAVLAK